MISMQLVRSITVLLTLFLHFGCQQREQKETTTKRTFERIKYNNPNVTVDLGVGLWAWPLPMDYDDDGDFDLLISCRDVPFNGIWFFENTSGTAFPIFESPIRIGDALTDIQI